MIPNAEIHAVFMAGKGITEAEYAAKLIQRLVDSGWERQSIAQHVGLTPRVLRMYRLKENKAQPNYCTIFALQSLIRHEEEQSNLFESFYND